MKLKATIGVSLLLALVMIVALAAPAMADIPGEVTPSATVPTEATISGSGNPPIIKAQWELPDDADPGHAIPGTQVNIVPSGVKDVEVYFAATDPEGLIDLCGGKAYVDVFEPSKKLTVTAVEPDNRPANPDAVTVAEVAALGNRVEISFPIEDGDDTALLGPWVKEVKIGDGVATRWELIRDMDHNTTIADVTVVECVFKMQVEAVKLPVSDPGFEAAKAEAVAAETGTINGCYYGIDVDGDLVVGVDPITFKPLDPDDLNDGPMTQAVADEIDEEIHNGETAAAYMAIIPIDYCQPAGQYIVEAWATDQAGNQSDHLVSYFEWVPTPVLQIDFNKLNFGSVIPCKTKWIAGDDIKETLGTAPPVKPTVKNEGNVDMAIGLHWTVMVGVEKGKTIGDPVLDDGYFDAKFLEETLTFKGCEEKWFTNLLPLCNTEKINFSLHAQSGTPSDVYKGEVTILVNGVLDP